MFEGFFNHKQNIEFRLNLIYLIVSEIKSSQDNVDYSFLLDLWNILVLSSGFDCEYLLLFSFLNKKKEGR